MSIGRSVLRLSMAVLALSAMAGTASAQDAVAQFYQGKQIRLLIGSSAGGGYDTYARTIARYLPKYIPGHPAVIPTNMPGAGSKAATSNLYTVAPKDGTVIGAIFPGAIMQPLLGLKGHVNYDPKKLVYLGSATRDVYLCIARTDAPVKSFKDVLSKELTVGASAVGASTHDFPALLDNVLGAKFKVVSGYPGSHEILLAIEKNEVQGVCGVAWPSIAAQHMRWLTEKFAQIIVQESAVGHPEMNKMHVPLAVDFAKTPEQRQILELVYSQTTFGRPYALPPDVPADRVAALRKAFFEVLSDKDLLADAQRMHLDISPLHGDEMQALITKIYATPPALVQKAKDALVYRK